jgi:peptidoglycan-N-acetylglucosamine deacetylase
VSWPIAGADFVEHVPTLMFGVIGALALIYGTGYFGRRFLQQRLLGRSRGQLYLTYDDGPSDRLTPELLDLLAARGAVATFFVKGCQVKGRAQLLERLVRDGHSLGTHSFVHVDGWKHPLRGLLDLQKGSAELRKSFPVKYLRPPYGRPTLFTFLFCWISGLRLTMWTIDAKDANSDIRKIDDVVGDLARNGGGVILMHDLDLELQGIANRHDHVLALTTALLDEAARRRLAISRFH